MTGSDEDPSEGGGEESDVTEREVTDETEAAAKDDHTEEPGVDGPDARDEQPDQTGTTPEKIPLSELREEVATDSVEESHVDEVTAVDDAEEADQDPGRDAGIPLSELRNDVVDGADGPETVGELFHEERVDEVESEAVWADLLMGSGETDAIFDPTAVEAELGRDYQIVPKTLCHRCEYFGDPPTLHCTHEGTTIHETVNMDHYRVSECPMVRSDHDSREE